MDVTCLKLIISLLVLVLNGPGSLCSATKGTTDVHGNEFAMIIVVYSNVS